MQAHEDRGQLTLQLDANMLDKYALKVIVVVQFVLATWAMVGDFGQAYMFLNLVLILAGLWAIGMPQSVDSVAMLGVFEVVAILSDILILATHYPPRRCDPGKTPCGAYRFGAAMSIIHLILKPIIVFLLVREYRKRGGDYSLGFPNTAPSGGYENLDQSVPTNSQVEPLPYNPQNQPFDNKPYAPQ